MDCSCPGLQAEREISALEEAGESAAAAALRRKLERPTLAGKPSWPASLPAWKGVRMCCCQHSLLLYLRDQCRRHRVAPHALIASLPADMSDNFLVLVAELERCFGAERVLPSRSDLREMNRCGETLH